MGLSRDMVRTAERKQQFWKRVEKERAMQPHGETDHAAEYSKLLNEEREHYKYLSKIHQLKRQMHK